MVIDPINIGCVFTIEEEHQPPLPDTETAHSPARSPTSAWSRQPAMFMLSGLVAVCGKTDLLSAERWPAHPLVAYLPVK